MAGGLVLFQATVPCSLGSPSSFSILNYTSDWTQYIWTIVGTPVYTCTYKRMSSPLPSEIVREILSFALPFRDTRLSLLTTCALFCDVSQSILYSHLHFASRSQLSSFIGVYSTSRCHVPHAPRSIELDIAGGGPNLFLDLYSLFSQCFCDIAERDELGRLVLDSLQLRMDSHAFDPRIEMIYSALSLIR